MKKITVFRGIIALAALSFTLTGHAQKKSVPGMLSVDEDTSVSPPQTHIDYKDNALYNIVLNGGKVASIFVNGRQVPADSFYVYNGLIQRIKAQIERDKKQAAQDKLQADRDKRQAEKDVKQAILDKVQAERDAEQAVKDKKLAEEDMQQAARDKVQAEIDAKQATLDKKQAELDKIQAEEDKALVKSLMAEVVKEGLAKDEKSVTSLILDESVFYLNGKKQSDELQKKFKEKFIKKPGNSVHYHNGRTKVGRVDE
ncbi:MAG: hypothetical protein J0H74_28360 [Chitinophagaceae bacterium]|nr:hypothetical protein [Chitinophagaceae bacterium]